MPTPVQIELRINEAGAVQGLRSVGVAARQTELSVRGIAAAGNQATESLTKMSGAFSGIKGSTLIVPRQLAEELGRIPGAAGQAGSGIRNGLAEADKSFLSTKDNLKLLKQEFNIEIPKSMMKVVAHSELVQKAIGAISGVLVAAGWAGIFVAAGEQVYELYKKWLDVGSAVRAYNEELQKQRQAAFVDTHSIDTSLARIRQVSAEGTQLRDQATNLQNPEHDAVWQQALSWNIPGYALYRQHKAKDLTEKSIEKQKEADQLTAHLPDMGHQKNLADIEARHAGDAALRESQRAAAAHSKELEIIAENERYRRQQDARNGVVGNRDELADAQRLAADRKFAAERKNLERDVTEEIIRLNNEANNASLRGEQLALAQRQQAKAEFVRQHGLHKAALAAIDRKYDEEAKRRLQDLQRETRRMEREAEAAGLTGIPAIQKRTENRVQDLNDNPELKQHPAILRSEIASVQKTGSADIERERQRFVDQVDQLSDQVADHEVSGFARIHMQATRELEALKRKFDETFGGDLKAKNPAEYLKGKAAYDQGRAAITKSENQQIRQLDEKNRNETLKLEDDARRRLLVGDRARTQQIYDEYEERKRALDTALRQQEISIYDYNRRVAANDLTLQADLQQHWRSTRDKLAGDLQGFFRNPGDFFKGLGEKMMAQSAASIMMKIPGMEKAASGGLEDIFNRGWFGGPNGGQKVGTPPFVDPEKQRKFGGKYSPAALSTSGQGMLAVSTATIHVVNATILGLGGGVGSVSSPGAFSGNIDAAALGGAAGTAAPSIVGGGQTSATQGISSGIAAAQSSASTLHGLGIGGKVTSKIGGLDKEDSEQSGNGGMLGGGGLKDNAGGALTGALGVYGAYKSNGGFSGALGGAMSGAQFGMAVGGPIGAAIGAIGGAVIGFMGFGGRGQAENYDKKQVRPRIADDERNFETGSSDYLTTYADLDSLNAEAKKTVKQFGHGGEGYYDDVIKKEIQTSQQKLTREAKAGRQNFSFSAVQFHTGDTVTSFGNLATSPTEGLVHAQIGEFIVKPNIAAENRSVLQALNAGMSMDQIVSSYRATMNSGQNQRGNAMVNRDVDLHFYSHDPRGTKQLFMDHKHEIRQALNESYGEYSGDGAY